MNFTYTGYFSMLLLIGTTMQSYYQAASSKTFFSNIPLWEIGKPTKELFNTTARMQDKDGGIGGNVEVVGYGGQTSNAKKLNSYFMPYGKRSLNVIEGISIPGGVIPADGTTNRDLEARNFNLVTIDGAAGLVGSQYQGVITFNPKQTIAGVGFTFKQSFWKNKDDVPTIWGEIAFPVQYIKNEMNLCENISQNGGGTSPTLGLDGAPHVGTMQEAFRQANWNYGKVDNFKDMSAWGVADVELRIGYNSMHSDDCDLNAYIGILAPSGTKIDQCNAGYLFNAVIGNNHHVGLLYGTHFGYTLYEQGNHGLRMDLDMSSKYLFSNHQWRSFDLVQQGEWSRYLEVYTSVNQATAATTGSPDFNLYSGTSGINVFTQKVRVTPRFYTNINWGLNYSYCAFDMEVGYNLWLRQAEKIDFPRDCCTNFPLTIAVKDIDGAGQTNLARTIKNDFPGSASVLANYANNVIQLSDLNLDSAAHPATLSNTIYAGVAYNHDCAWLPWSIGFGGMYEFCSMNTSFDRWNVLGKFQFSY